jgi:nicotinate dehydrogenase subunit B
MGDRKPNTTPVSDPKAGLSFDRREFVKIFGGGIVVLFALDEPFLSGQEVIGRGYPTDLNAYLKIGENGKVTIFSGKIEMGQGVITSLAQMAADELDVSLQSVEMIMGDTSVCPYDSGTYGSMSTRFFGPSLRAAAAEARAILVDLASEQLKIPKDKLSVESGSVFVTSDRKKRVTFGQLAKGQKITRKLDGKAVTKTVANFKLMGKPVQRLDAVAKVTGKAQYAGDIRLPGAILYARILRPPAHRAVLKSVDPSAAEKMPGVRVINENGLVAVLHEDPEIAERALAAVKADYDKPQATLDEKNIFDHLVKVAPPAQIQERKGDLAQGEKGAASIFEGRYVCGYGAHASIETHTALANYDGGKLTAWVATQTPFPDRQSIARELGLNPEDVRVVTPFVGGGFGGKSSARQAVEAARLAKIVGRPVQVCWTRAEEFFYDTFRPAAVVRIRSGIDGAGKICLYDYHVYFAGSRSAEQFYDVPHNLIHVYGQWSGDTTKAHPFGVGAWRAPGANINVFARESQIDLMAAKIKADPLEFRLNNTSDPRMRSVLQAAAERFGWKRAATPSGRGYGIACGIDAGTYVAMIAEIQIDKATGRVKVARIVASQEMGIVINPEGARMQMEGCIQMGLGYTLSEDITFKGGEIFTRSFSAYELPRFSVLPQIDVSLVKNDALVPQGGGEPAITPVGAAVGNAIFDATGARLYQLPMTPERVKEALKSV